MKKHIVRSGDSLHSIARTYGVSSWQSLYNARENAALRAKRKSPHSIKPGDVVYIPSTAADAKRRAETIRRLEKLRRDAKKSMEQELRYLAEQKRNVKKWSDGIDTTAFVAGLTTGLGKLVGKGYKAAAATGKELTKLNAEVAREVAKNSAQRPIDFYAGQATLRGDESLAWAFTKTLLISYNQMTSPSYWANQVIKLRD